MKKNATSNIDSLKMHVLTTGVDHAQYMTYRKAIKAVGMTSAAFLRTLVTIGLNECQSIAAKGGKKETLLKQKALIERQLAALNGVSINIGTQTEFTPSGRFPKGQRNAIISDYINLNPSAKVKEIQALLAQHKGQPVPLKTAMSAFYAAKRAMAR